MDDYLERIYIDLFSDHYRITIFENSMWIERQSPRAENLRYERDDTVYKDGWWNLKALEQFVQTRYVTEVEAQYSEDARAASSELPTVDDVRAANPKADGYFTVRPDGGGEFVLWFIDYRGSQVGRHGEPVTRHIRTYKSVPAPSLARQDAETWLSENAHWL